MKRQAVNPIAQRCLRGGAGGLFASRNYDLVLVKKIRCERHDSEYYLALIQKTFRTDLALFLVCSFIYLLT